MKGSRTKIVQDADHCKELGFQSESQEGMVSTKGCQGQEQFPPLQKNFVYPFIKYVFIPYEVLGIILGYAYCTSYQPTIVQKLFCYQDSNDTGDQRVLCWDGPQSVIYTPYSAPPRPFSWDYIATRIFQGTYPISWSCIRQASHQYQQRVNFLFTYPSHLSMGTKGSK